MYYIFISKFSHAHDQSLTQLLTFLGLIRFQKMSYSAGNGDLGPHKHHHAHHYGPTSNLFSKICEMASRLVDDARQSAERQMRQLDGAPPCSSTHGSQCCGGETQFGKCWPTLGNATREPQKLPLAKCCCNFTTMLFFAISQVFGTTGNADVRVTMKVHIYYMGLII